jgi:hypothetical protein
MKVRSIEYPVNVRCFRSFLHISAKSSVKVPQTPCKYREEAAYEAVLKKDLRLEDWLRMIVACPRDRYSFGQASHAKQKTGWVFGVSLRLRTRVLVLGGQLHV